MVDLNRQTNPSHHARERSRAITQLLLKRSLQINWYKRHLNWTAFLSLLLSLAAGLLLFAIINTIYEITENDAANWSISVATLFLPLIPFRWILKRKDQSQRWLLVAWIPWLGWMVPIVLPNSDQQKRLKEKEKTERESQR